MTMFPKITLIPWLTELKSSTDFDLTNSGLSRYDEFTYDGHVPPSLRDFDDPPDDFVLEEVLAKEYGVSPSQVHITARCQHSNFIATAAARDLKLSRKSGSSSKQLNAVVEEPSYQPLLLTPTGFGLSIKPFLRDPEGNYQIDIGAIEAAVDQQTCLIVVTNRHNPSGQLIDRETISEIARIASKNEAYLLVDEVYSPFFENTPHADTTPFGGISGADLPNTVITNSMTKFFGLYDISIGWIISDPEFIETAKIVDQHTNVVAKPSRELARRALYNSEVMMNESRDMMKTKYEMLDSFVAEHNELDGDVIHPNIIAFLKHDRVNGDALVRHAREVGVALQPGRFFGNEYDFSEFFRLSLGREEDELRQGLDILSDLIREI